MPSFIDLQRGTAFRTDETHNFPKRIPGLESRTSEEFGWQTVHATMRRGAPCEAFYTAIKHVCVTLFIKPADIEYRIGEMRVRRILHSGSYTIVPGNIAFGETLHSSSDMLHLHLRDSTFKQAADLIGWDRELLDIKPAIGATDPLVAHIGTLFNIALRDLAPLSSLQADHLATILAIRLIQNHAAPNLLKQMAGGDKLIKRHHLDEIEEYINENLTSPIKIGNLARIAGVSVGYFIRQFRQIAGTTPHQYVMRARVERAKTLLVQAEEDLATIAMECGFSSQEHMTHVFGNIVGMTPGSFRRLKRSK